jgi:hypothetical protein
MGRRKIEIQPITVSLVNVIRYPDGVPPVAIISIPFPAFSTLYARQTDILYS